MLFTLILENKNGDGVDMTTTANKYMTSEIDGLYPPAGTISTSTYAGLNGSYLNNAFIINRIVSVSTWLTLREGENKFYLRAASGLRNLKVRLIHRNAYLGV